MPPKHATGPGAAAMALGARGADHAAAPSRTRDAPSLAWSELAYLLSVALAALIAVDPIGWQAAHAPYVKHLPLALALAALVLSAIGRRLSLRPDERIELAGLFAVAWPLGLLALMITAGSLYARLFLGVQVSFLNLGVYMALTFGAAAMVLYSGAPARLAHAYLRILLAAAGVMAAGLIYFHRTREIYHEQIFLVIPMAVLCFLAWRQRAARWAGLLFFLGMALLSAKNTSYLIALLVAAYLALVLWLPRVRGAATLDRLWGYYLVFVALLAASGGILFLLYFREVYLPSGNVAYRAHTYALAWQQFLESPVWGTLFSVESVRKFTLYTIGVARNMLPTHSDIMDLLANGGAIAIGLWLLGIVRIGRLAWRKLLAPRLLAHPWAAYGHTLAALSLAGIVTYAFNPILLQPGMAYLLWTSLGLLLGLTLRAPMPST